MPYLLNQTSLKPRNALDCLLEVGVELVCLSFIVHTLVNQIISRLMTLFLPLTETEITKHKATKGLSFLGLHVYSIILDKPLYFEDISCCL